MPEIKRYTPEPDFVSGEFERVEMQERRDGEWVRYEDVLPLFAERVCPCVIASEPCRPVCSCVEWVSSYGCKCCAEYGSEEQRKKRAEHIVQAVTAFDAERDPTPVTAEWLDGVLGDGGAKEADGYAFWWISIGAMIGVVRRNHIQFELQVDFDDALGRTPTRGDVLTALRLFGQTRQSTH